MHEFKSFKEACAQQALAWHARAIAIQKMFLRLLHTGQAVAGMAYPQVRQKSPNVDSWIARTPAGGTVKIPFPETRDYVADIQRVEQLYRRAYHGELYG